MSELEDLRVRVENLEKVTFAYHALLKDVLPCDSEYDIDRMLEEYFESVETFWDIKNAGAIFTKKESSN